MGITTRDFGPYEKGAKLTIAEMDENFNYLNDYGVVTTENEYYVLAGFDGDHPSNGSKASPYPTIALARAAAEAAGHNDSNPAFIILLSNITENVTIGGGGVWLTSAHGTGTHGSFILTGTITINGASASLVSNHFSISNLRIVAPNNAPGILFTGSNPQRLFMRDLWIDASGTTGSCVTADNTGTGSVCHLNTGHLTHSGTGDVYCFKAEKGNMSLTDIETSGSNVQVAKVGLGVTLTLDSSEIDATGSAAIEVYGGTLVITRSTINNTQSGGHGIACSNSGSIVTVGECLFNISSLGVGGKAVFGSPATTSFLFYQYVAFVSGSNRGITASPVITATALATTFV
jgi:hypothetical protein